MDFDFQRVMMRSKRFVRYFFSDTLLSAQPAANRLGGRGLTHLSMMVLGQRDMLQHPQALYRRMMAFFEEK
jgi:hypothetical protein